MRPRTVAQQNVSRTRTGVRVLLRGILVGLSLLLAVPGLTRGAIPQAPSASRGTIEVERLSPDRMTVTPGAAVTAAFRVVNRSDTVRTVRPSVSLPSEWTLATSLSAFSLPPNEGTMRLLSVSVPDQAPVRRASVRLHVSDASSSVPSDSARVEVQVRAVHDLDVSLLNAPPTVRSGTAYVASFAVTNRGNVTSEIQLQTESARSFPTRLDSSRMTLPPSATRQVRATVQTVKQEAAATDFVRLQARGTPRTDDSLASASVSTASARASVEVIPAAGHAPRRGPRYPVTMRLHTLGRGHDRGGQFQIQGRGDVTDDGSHHAEFFLRGPGQRDRSTFGQRDIYRATYTTDHWTLRGGDQVYEITPLGAPGRFGFGGEVRHQMDDWTLGTFVHTTRKSNLGSQVASYATYDAHPRADVTASLLHNEGLYEGTLATLEGSVVPWTNASLTVESGIGTGLRGTGGGIRLELTGNHEWGQYRTRHLYADPQFPNARSGDRRTSAYARVRVTDQAFLFGSARRLRRTSVADVPATVYQRARLGGTLRGALGPHYGSLRLSGRDIRTPFRNQQLVTMRGRLRTGPIQISAIMEAGQIAHSGTEFAPFRSVRSQLSLHTRWQQFTGYLEHTTTPLYTPGARDARVSMGATSRTQLGDHTELFLEAEWRNVSSEAVSVRRFAAADLRHELPFGHTLRARAQLQDYTGTQGGTPAFKLSYAVPIGVSPISTADRPKVSGRVVDATNGTGLPNVLVRLGSEKQFTDETGQFSFQRPEDDAYLHVDRSTLPANHVPMRPLPMPIRPSDAASEISIPVQESASLTADVIVYDHLTLRAAIRGEAPDSVGVLGDAILEATDETGRQRRLTNGNGRASFARLRPGTWTVRLVHPPLPDHQILDQNAYRVTLTPGEHAELRMRVLPKQRRLDVRQGESLTPDPDSSTTGHGAPEAPRDDSRSGRIHAPHKAPAPSDSVDAGRGRALTPRTAPSEKNDRRSESGLRL